MELRISGRAKKRRARRSSRKQSKRSNVCVRIRIRKIVQVVKPAVLVLLSFFFVGKRNDRETPNFTLVLAGPMGLWEFSAR